MICVYIYVCINLSIYLSLCISLSLYIYIHTLSSSRKPSGRFLSFFFYNGFRRRHHPTFLLWFPSLFSLSFSFYMVSVVAGDICLWFPSLVFFFSVVARNNISYGFRRWILGGFCRHRRIQHFRTLPAISRFFLCF